jgi:hypothetical protein
VQLGLLSNAVWRLKFSWICKENQEEKLGSLPMERKEQERALVTPGKRMVEMTVGGDKGEI